MLFLLTSDVDAQEQELCLIQCCCSRVWCVADALRSDWQIDEQNLIFICQGAKLWRQDLCLFAVIFRLYLPTVLIFYYLLKMMVQSQESCPDSQ